MTLLHYLCFYRKFIYLEWTTQMKNHQGKACLLINYYSDSSFLKRERDFAIVSDRLSCTV